MKQNKILGLLVGVLFAFAFSGCKSTTPTLAPSQQALPTTGAYPASIPPAAPTQGSYPAAATVVLPTPADYPSPVSGSTAVAWADAEQIILKGDVAQILQTSSLDVTLTLKSGQIDVTTAPSADAVKNAITTCGDLCSNVSFTIQ